jgi:hypothetical protein
MGKRQWGIVAGWLAAIAGLAGFGVLVYLYWDSLVSVVLSPIGGLVVKVLFGGKLVKTLVAVGFAVVAGAVAVRRKLRGPREPEPAAAPPVYGPPEPELGAATEPEHGTAPERGTEPVAAPAPQRAASS